MDVQLYKMKIRTGNFVFGILALITSAIWYLLLKILNSPLINVIFLWVAMILISIADIIVYIRNDRTIEILRIHFLVLGIPIYQMMIYYIYKLFIENDIPKHQQLFHRFRKKIN